MSIDARRLAPYLKDHADTTGRVTERFVCPITLRQCDTAELVEGHILNRRLKTASRRTVIQYGAIDGFYGTRVEPGMIRFLNLLERDGEHLTKHDRPTRLVFADGSDVPVFPLRRGVGPAGSKFAVLNVPAVDGFLPVAAKVATDDARLSEPYQLEVMQTFLESHWTAAMLKAGFLTLFDLVGYRSVYCPFGDTLRRTLAAYYNDHGATSAADRYFREFRNAVKLLAVRKQGETENARWAPYDFDTLTDREVFFHYTRGRLLFAVTCLFRVNRVTTSVTLPDSVSKSDAGQVLSCYKRYMHAPNDYPQVVNRARFRNDCWEVEETPRELRFLDGAHGP